MSASPPIPSRRGFRRACGIPGPGAPHPPCTAPGEGQARFFDISRGSAAECAAILDILALRGIAPAPLAERGRSLLHRSVGLLSGLSRSAIRRSGLP